MASLGDKHDASTVDLARSFARRGYVVAAINYRLLALKYCYGASSEGLLPACYRAALAARDDAEAAVARLRAHAARFRVEPRRIAVAGESAGGIASYLVGTDRRGGNRVSAGALARSGVPSYLDVIAGPAHDPYVAERGRLLAEATCFFARALDLAAEGDGCGPRLHTLEAAARSG